MIGVAVALFFFCLAVGRGIALLLHVHDTRQGRRGSTNAELGCVGFLIGVGVFLVAAFAQVPIAA